MKLRPLHSRNDLLVLIEPASPTKACSVSLQNGRVKVIGGFRPPNDLPFIVAEVTGRHGSVWTLALVCGDSKFTHRVLESIEWEYWDGEEGRYHPIYDGDDPILFNEKRKEARR